MSTFTKDRYGNSPNKGINSDPTSLAAFGPGYARISVGRINMRKQLTIGTQTDIDACLAKIHESAELARSHVLQLVDAGNADDFLYQMKFKEIGCDPMDPTRRLNLIEQLNQTFAYMASLKAASYLLRGRPPFNALTLNLGTMPGWDIESDENGGLVAEVFAAVSPQNNRKLDKDLKKVAKEKVQHRYVFFMCPGIEAGPYIKISVPEGINIVSLGCEIQ
jgi:hypothetical protein